ncbi:MAG TPA: DUF2062 domain-containing protein [Steroidobacteraceae bacterium]|nr:DUF2062 domain-containing protein [Steroidobacteraceae bacterium]
MQHWLKSITPARHSLEKRWYLKPFTALVVDRGCWAFKRTRVINAFSLGLLIAFVPPIPPLPLHLTLCLTLGVIFRLNLPVLFATVFVSNPLTWFPQVAGSIWVGAKLMGLNLMPMLHGLSHRDFRAQIHELWEPLLLGAIVLGVCAAVAGYLTGQCIWRGWAIYRLRRRRARSNVRVRALD